MTTLGVGGPALYFADAFDEETAIEAYSFAHRQHMPFLVMGGGSNLVVADAGFPGVVVRMRQMDCVELANRTDPSRERVFRVGAGMNWDQFVSSCVNEGLAGIECLSGIPGTVGGTPVQNVGAYGQEASQTIDSVRAYDCRQQKIRELSNRECGFSYRRSVFNTSEQNRFIVLSVTFSFRVGGAPTIQYSDVQELLTNQKAAPTLKSVREAVLSIRKKKAMVLDAQDPNTRSVGSFFKNPVVSRSFFENLTREYPKEKIPHYPLLREGTAGDEHSPSVKLAAAWLIEQSGFYKGYPADPISQKAVGISTKHTLAIINRGGATAREVIDLMREIQAGVERRFHIRLEVEPKLIGFEGEHQP